MNAIILCGGLSTRLGDITKSTPKILLTIGDKTVLDWQLAKLKEAGITHVVLAAGHLADVLRREVGERRNGIEITYAIERNRLGTGGAIKYALSHVGHPEDHTLVLNGDVLTTVPIAEMLGTLDTQSEGMILASYVPDASTYGTLIYDHAHRLTAFREKEGMSAPGYINGGFYLFTPHAHKHFPSHATFSIEYDVFPNMKNLYVYPSDHPWVDVGVPDRLAWAREHWKKFL